MVSPFSILPGRTLDADFSELISFLLLLEYSFEIKKSTGISLKSGSA